MTENQSDDEVAISAELTPTGVKARAKSRLISAIDQLGGNLLSLINVPLERRLNRSRAVGRADVKLIDGLADLRLEHLHDNPDFAAEALRTHLKTSISRQENKAQVVAKALEDLHSDPPSDQDNTSGREELGEEFIDRFERYAEGATTEQLRERWGRVLASEIRKPDTFSNKVLRVTDELDADTAELFERLCEHRIGNTLPMCLVPDLSYGDKMKLVSAGLLIDPGATKQLRMSHKIRDTLGNPLIAIPFGRYALTFSESAKIPKRTKTSSLISSEGTLAITVYIITEEAVAISSILKNTEAQSFDRVLDCIAREIAPTRVDGHEVFGKQDVRPYKTFAYPVEG